MKILNEDLACSFMVYPLPTWAHSSSWATLKPDGEEWYKCKVIEYKHVDKVISDNQSTNQNEVILTTSLKWH